MERGRGKRNSRASEQLKPNSSMVVLWWVLTKFTPRDDRAHNGTSSSFIPRWFGFVITQICSGSTYSLYVVRRHRRKMTAFGKRVSMYYHHGHDYHHGCLWITLAFTARLKQQWKKVGRQQILLIRTEVIGLTARDNGFHSAHSLFLSLWSFIW